MLEYSQIAYPIVGLWIFCIATFFWGISRLGPKNGD